MARKPKAPPPEELKVGDVVWLAWAQEQCRNYGVKEVVLIDRTECKWYFTNNDKKSTVSWSLDDNSKDRRIYRTKTEATLFVMQVLQRRYKAAKEVWKRRHADMVAWHEQHFKESVNEKSA